MQYLFNPNSHTFNTVSLAGQGGVLSGNFIGIQEDQGGEVFSVKAYGATGNGATNDTAAIQSAINAAQSAGGGTVYFSPGTYLISATLNITADNIILAGSGWGSIIYAANSMNATMVQASAATGVRYGFGMRDLFLNGNQNYQTSGSGIKLVGCYNALIQNVWVKYAHDYGIWLSGNSGQPMSAYNTIRESQFTDGYMANACGVYMDSYSEFNRVINCNTDWHMGDQGKGIYINGGNNYLEGGQSDANGYNLYLASNVHNKFKNYSFDRSYYREIFMTGGATTNIFEGCQFGYYVVAPLLQTAIASGQSGITSIALESSVVQTIPTWGVSVVVSYGTANAETFTVTNAGVAAGATSIPVNSQTAAKQHNVGDYVVLRYRGVDIEGSANTNFFTNCIFQGAEGLPSNINWQYFIGEDANCNNVYMGNIFSGGNGNSLQSGSVLGYTNISGTSVTPGGNVLSVSNGGTGSSTQNFVDLTSNQTINGIKTFSTGFSGAITDKGGQVYNVKAYGAAGNGSTNDTTAIQSAIAAASAAGGGVVYFPEGSYYTSSTSRTDSTVSYSGGTWTDSSITSGDVGSYVLGANINNAEVPQITSVTPGVSFTTDIAPTGTISSQAITIVNPAIVLPAGIALRGVGASFSQSAGFGTGNPSASVIVDHGTGITCLIRGGSGSSTAAFRYAIEKLSIHGNNQTTLYGVYIGNFAWYCTIRDASISYHGVAGLAVDGNINSDSIYDTVFFGNGKTSATTYSGGVITHPYYMQPSSSLNFYNCFFDQNNGWGMCDAKATGATSVCLYNCQFNVTNASAATGSGVSAALADHANGADAKAVVIGGWSESAALYDFDLYGSPTIINVSMSSQNATAHARVTGGTAQFIGCRFENLSGASVTFGGSGYITWMGCTLNDSYFYSGVGFANGSVPVMGSNIGSQNSGGLQLGVGNAVRMGSGVPSTGTGIQGDFYFRTDGAAGSSVYVKTGSSTWTAVA